MKTFTPENAQQYMQWYEEIYDRARVLAVGKEDGFITKVDFWDKEQMVSIQYEIYRMQCSCGIDFMHIAYADFFTPDEVRKAKIDKLIN